MQTAKTVEIKSINVLSVFRFFGGMFLMVGLIVGLFGNLLRIDIMSSGFIRIFPFMSRLGSGVIIGIVFGVIYGLSAGIGFSIFALFYNFFAALLGGLKFLLKDSTTE